MAVGTFKLYTPVLGAMLDGTLGDITAGPVAAVLLSNAYVPQLESDASWGTVKAHELPLGDYQQQALTGLTQLNNTGKTALDSADIQFTANGTITGAKYCVLAQGAAGALGDSDALLGYIDLDDSGASTTVSATNGEFTVQAPVGGWFELARSGA